MQNEGVGKVERYSSGGLVMGIVGLVLLAAVMIYGIADPEAGFAPWAYPFCLLLGVLTWMVMIRPAVRLHGDEIELRNPLHTRWVPFAVITSVEIAQVTILRSGEERYVGSGFGRTRRTIRSDSRAAHDTPLEKRSTAWLIEDKIERRIAAARERRTTGDAVPGVRHAWAWPEIALLGVLAAATVVTALVG
ncbi:hypothetical protein FHP29_10635 [Nocardioides albidus]|uniref:PH domain-containing protein n=1 Tax=Nocardioides albidus TaxID=1517589 RepID=A0A5C4VX35_9ACTN|nr:hypothetical protein [Nocardioides albidus]TNM40494.1 hypothetical protein FHP29_10635 [Nocardioides albidus]